MNTQENRKIASRLSNRNCKRILAIALLVMLVVSLLPLYTAARYSYAGVDDYRYGRTTHAVWTSTYSVFETVAEAGRVAAATYTDWQGSIAAIFLMSLHPGVFGDHIYGLSTVLLLTALVLCVLYFVQTACRHIFRAETDDSFIVACIAAICCVQFVPSPVESYYWFNGGVYYTFFFSLSLFAAAILIRRTRQRNAWQCAVLVITALLLGFGNLITGLLCCVLLALYAASTGLLHRRDLFLWVLLAVLAVAFACNVFSPGNGVRQAENAEKAKDVLPAVFSAVQDAFVYIVQWLQTPALFVCLLPVPLLWQMAERSQLQFRFPILVSVASVLLLAAGFTPNEYALGFPGEARIVDIQYYMFVLLLLLNVLWYTGWVRRRCRISVRGLRIVAVTVVSAAAIAACTITIHTRNSATASAILLQTSGKAQSYAAVWERRLAILRNPTETNVVLPKLSQQPPLLCMVDLASTQSDPFYFYNEQVAAYFGIDTVLREP